MRAVLIQDDVVSLDALRPMLANRGIKRVEVAEGSEAVRLVSRVNPELVLLPAAEVYDRFGHYLPALLHDASPSARVLLLGGHKPSSKGLPWPNVDGFLPYPIDAERLSEAIDELFQGGARA